MNSRETLDVQLNTFGNFQPKVPESYKSVKFVFLANGSPITQASVLDQVSDSAFSIADTMNLWIDNAKDDLMDLLKRVDGLILNDEEAKMLTGETNLIRAGRKVLEYGPKLVIVKKGEHGSLLFFEDLIFSSPAVSLENVVDPTGAGDSFAGAMMAYLTSKKKTDLASIKKSVVFGNVMGSFAVEGYGTEGLLRVKKSDIKKRMSQYKKMVSF